MTQNAKTTQNKENKTKNNTKITYVLALASQNNKPTKQTQAYCKITITTIDTSFLENMKVMSVEKIPTIFICKLFSFFICDISLKNKHILICSNSFYYNYKII